MNDHEISLKLDQIVQLLGNLEHLLLLQGKELMSALDDLTTQVAANTSVEQSAITLIQGIAAQLAAAGQDPIKLAALTGSLKTSADSLAAAVAANTPVAVP